MVKFTFIIIIINPYDLRIASSLIKQRRFRFFSFKKKCERTTRLGRVAREATKFNCDAAATAFNVSAVLPLDILRGRSFAHVAQLVPAAAEELEAFLEGSAQNWMN